MQVYHLLHVLHLGIHRQFHASEDARNHLRSQVVVVVERPTDGGLPTLRARLADIVKQSSPAQPEVVAALRHVVHHLQCVVEVVLVRLAVACLHHVERT